MRPRRPDWSSGCKQYLLKAVREAKLNTSWTDPDPTYAETLTGIRRRGSRRARRRPLPERFPSRSSGGSPGLAWSIPCAQTLLKIASPGVPDIYQGCELWDLSLVDPDNRRPVDYEFRKGMLQGMCDEIAAGISRAQLAERLFGSPEDGSIKLYLVWTALTHRKDDLSALPHTAITAPWKQTVI